MNSEKFCLRWNDFESNISNAFKELREEKDFFDVTLACDNEQVQAHKVILSACSPLFRGILRRNPHQHPLLYMKGVKFTDMQAVLTFMYQGEVNVAQEELHTFLSVAEDLQVKGLTQTQTKKHQTKSSAPEVKTLPRVPDRGTQSPPKHTAQSFPLQTEEEIQEIVPVKSEPKDPQPHVLEVTDSEVYSVVPQEQIETSYQDETGYEEYGDYQEQVYNEMNTSSLVHTGTREGTGTGSGVSPDRKMLYEYIKREEVGGKSVSMCTLCGKYNSNKQNIVNHVESVHFPNMFTYNCKYCDKTYNAKNSLYVHICTNHRQEKSGL